MPYLATSIFQPLTTKITNFLSIILQEDKKKKIPTKLPKQQTDWMQFLQQHNQISLASPLTPVPILQPHDLVTTYRKVILFNQTYDNTKISNIYFCFTQRLLEINTLFFFFSIL